MAGGERSGGSPPRGGDAKTRSAAPPSRPPHEAPPHRGPTPVARATSDGKAAAIAAEREREARVPPLQSRAAAAAHSHGAVSRRYLHEDLSLSCDSDEYRDTRGVAMIFVVVWPIGVPALYAVLLWASHDAVLSGIPTPLSRATAFLSEDYEQLALFWEARRRTPRASAAAADGASALAAGARAGAQADAHRLGAAHRRAVGAGPRARRAARQRHLPRAQPRHPPDEAARSPLPLPSCPRLLSPRPDAPPPPAFPSVCRRAEDGLLTAMAQLALVLVYTSVLLIKSCNLSRDVCRAYGFGDARGARAAAFARERRRTSRRASPQASSSSSSSSGWA